MFEINFLPIISGTRNDSFPAASCIHKPVINEIGSRSRDAGFPKEAAWAQLGCPCGTHCDCLRGRRAAQESPSLSSQEAWQMFTCVKNSKRSSEQS